MEVAMGDNWAYTTKGRLKNHDCWDWFGPSRKEASVNKLYDAAREHFWSGEKRDVLNKGFNVIGFDGKQWMVGHIALPSAVLDSQAYPPLEYAHDHVNRPVHFLHGFTSETSQFPEHLPLIDRQHFKELHEQHIIPIWKHSIENSAADIERNLTSFKPDQEEAAIISHLPADAVDLLRKAHAQGRPIALQYESAGKNWTRLQGFENNIKRQARKESGESTTQAVGHARLSNTHGPSQDSAKRTEETTTNWIAQVWEHPGGKLAVIGGTVCIGTLLGYWMFRTKQKARHEHVGVIAR
jgi:hypothetical protein